MKIRVPILLLTMALPLALAAAEETPLSTPKPTILKRWLRSLGIQKGPTTTTATGFKGLEIGLQVEPSQIKVTEVKQMKVTVTLINRGKKMAQLDFPSSQRIEILVKSKEGKTIEQWSEDQAFANEPSMVTINPNERLEYIVSVATRDMAAGEAYSVEAFFPNFDQLRKVVSVTAVTPAPPTATPAAGTAPGVPPVTPATPAPKRRKIM
jgi:hypothetical protein